MTVGALFIAYLTDRLEALPALLMFLVVMVGLSAADVKLLFANHVNWNTGLMYIEYSMIFVITVAVKYVLEERNKKFIKGAFAKYVSPAIIDSIMKDPSKLTVGGEKRELTIVFSDIRSFTTFSEKMDAKQLAQFLNDYLGIMTDLVFDNEGTLDKYIGDAVMAFWGAPLDQPKHAANACRAAIKMQQALAQHRGRYKETYGIDVNIGIGINSGGVNVGNMGSERIFEYTVIGDHVNLASRLEGLTKYYGAGILTTRFTFDDITKAGEQHPSHRILDFVKVKGKKTAIELIEVMTREVPAEGLRLFSEGREYYSRKDWDIAIDKFSKANELIRPSADEADGPCEMYVERCKEFKQNPPSADWDGSWEMTSK
jgi:adenylate cyclase